MLEKVDAVEPVENPPQLSSSSTSVSLKKAKFISAGSLTTEQIQAALPRAHPLSVLYPDFSFNSGCLPALLLLHMVKDPEELALPAGNLAEFLVDLSCLEVVRSAAIPLPQSSAVFRVITVPARSKESTVPENVLREVELMSEAMTELRAQIDSMGSNLWLDPNGIHNLRSALLPFDEWINVINQDVASFAGRRGDDDSSSSMFEMLLSTIQTTRSNFTELMEKVNSVLTRQPASLAGTRPPMQSLVPRSFPLVSQLVVRPVLHCINLLVSQKIDPTLPHHGHLIADPASSRASSPQSSISVVSPRSSSSATDSSVKQVSNRRSSSSGSTSAAPLFPGMISCSCSFVLPRSGANCRRRLMADQQCATALIEMLIQFRFNVPATISLHALGACTCFSSC